MNACYVCRGSDNSDPIWHELHWQFEHLMHWLNPDEAHVLTFMKVRHTWPSLFHNGIGQIQVNWQMALWCNSGLGNDIQTFVYIVTHCLKSLWQIYWLIFHFLHNLLIITYKSNSFFFKALLAKVLNLHCHWTWKWPDLCPSAIWNFSSCLTSLPC